MKLPKTMLIFLFVISSIGVFNYALKRTEGNIYHSTLFLLYFLGIKTGLIKLKVPVEFTSSQSNQESVNRIVKSPGYHPYVSYYNDYYDNYRPFQLYMNKIQDEVPKYDVSSHSYSTITQLRGAGVFSSRISEAGWLLLTIWMLQYSSVGFQPLRPAIRPPHVDSLDSLLFPKPSPKSRLRLSESNQISTNLLPTKIQAASFVRADKTIDLELVYAEVTRRALIINNPNFNCSFERFTILAYEGTRCDTGTTRDAISVLQG